MKYRVSILASLLLSMPLLADSIALSSGWQLKGSERGFASVESFSKECIESVFTFDDKNKDWKAYSKESINLPSIKDIKPQSGFWVKANSDNCVVDDDSDVAIADKFNLKSGWQILGTSSDIDSINIFNQSCVDSIFAYDSSWSSYSPNTTTNSLENIPKNSGFWIKANAECDIEKSSTSTEVVADNNDTIDDTSSVVVDVNSTDFQITSRALKSGNTFPFSYSCDGLNLDGESGGLSPNIVFKNTPNDAKSLTLTMHILKGEGDKQELEVLWIVYNIPATTLELEESNIDSVSAGTLGLSHQDRFEYFPPCSKSPNYNEYTVTAYALSSDLDIAQSDATFANIIERANEKVIDKTTLIVNKVRYNPNDEEQLFVPKSVPTTCESKSVGFNSYDSTAVICDEANNKMSIVSKTGIPERSNLDGDKLNVGTEAWIGRVAIDRESSWSFPIEPTYLPEPSNNINIHHPIGITTDGIPIIHYAKESEPDEISDLSKDYSDRDTVLLGEIDQCGGHAGNGEDYHYHYAPLCMMDTHDPSEPLAYMFDGLPLYFGQAGGTVTEAGGKTSVNYGAGRYSSLDFRPSDVKDGTNPLDECNAYDLNGDGATSGYVYYTTKEPPYTIGCFRAEANQESSVANPVKWEVERDISFSGADVTLTDYYTLEFDFKTWFAVEITPQNGNKNIAEGKKALVLYRKLTSDEEGYQESLACWQFRYRLDSSDTTGANDTTATHCREQ